MTQILMPALSPTMEEGKLAKWLVKEGDEVHSGDILAEIETDRATMEFEAVDEGKIGKLLVPEGTEGVKVNQPIATLLADGESAAQDIPSAMASIKDAVSAEAKKAEPPPAKPQQSAALKKAETPPPEPKNEAPQKSAPATPQHETPASSGADHRVFASPLAKRLAANA